MSRINPRAPRIHTNRPTALRAARCLNRIYEAMGNLRITFRIGLAYPVILQLDPSSQAPLLVHFAPTGNTVRIDFPEAEPLRPDQKERGAVAQINLHVERQCSAEDGRNTAYWNLQQMKITHDAGQAFWLAMETIAESELRRDNTAPGFPITPADEIQYNPMVRTCEYEWVYDGEKLSDGTLGAVPGIVITGKSWEEARYRLARSEPLPAYLSFVVAAAYFSRGDPLRTIIMACAAWETALRHYLAHVAPKTDPSFLKLSQSKKADIPSLLNKVQQAKGLRVFEDRTSAGTQEFYKQQRKLMNDMPKWRNQLLHQGYVQLPPGAAEDVTITLLNAIDWLGQ